MVHPLQTDDIDAIQDHLVRTVAQLLTTRANTAQWRSEYAAHGRIDANRWDSQTPPGGSGMGCTNIPEGESAAERIVRLLGDCENSPPALSSLAS